MIRTQVQLTEDQMRKLRRAAREQGVSIAEIVRRCLDRGLDDEVAGRKDAYARIGRLVGAYRDRVGASDVAVEHDRYLDESLDKELGSG